MKVVLLRVGLISNTNLSLRRGFQTKFLQISPGITMIGCLTLNLKRGEMLIHQEKYQLVESVVRSMWVNVLLERIVAMVVEKVTIW